MSTSGDVLAVTKIFDRGKTVIPAEVRRRLGVSDGDRLVWLEDQMGRIYVAPGRRKGKFRVTG